MALAEQLTRIGNEYRNDLCNKCKTTIIDAQRRCGYKDDKEPNLYQRIVLSNAANNICNKCRQTIINKAQHNYQTQVTING